MFLADVKIYRRFLAVERYYADEQSVTSVQEIRFLLLYCKFYRNTKKHQSKENAFSFRNF